MGTVTRINKYISPRRSKGGWSRVFPLFTLFSYQTFNVVTDFFTNDYIENELTTRLRKGLGPVTNGRLLFGPYR